MKSAHETNPGERGTFLKTFQDISSQHRESDVSAPNVPMESTKGEDIKAVSMPKGTLSDIAHPGNYTPEWHCSVQTDVDLTALAAAFAAKPSALMSTAHAAEIGIPESEQRPMSSAADLQPLTDQGFTAVADSVALKELIARLAQDERMPSSAASAWLNRFRQLMAMTIPLQGNALSRDLSAEGVRPNPTAESAVSGSFQNGLYQSEFRSNADLIWRMEDSVSGQQTTSSNWRLPPVGDVYASNFTETETTQPERNRLIVLHSENWEKFSSEKSASEKPMANSEIPEGPAVGNANGPPGSFEKAHLPAPQDHLSRMAASSETEQRCSGSDVYDLSQKRETVKEIVNTDSTAVNKNTIQALPGEESVSKLISDAQVIRDPGTKLDSSFGDELGGKMLKVDGGNPDLGSPGSQNQTIDRSFETASSAKEVETSRGSLPDQTLDQIVKKAFIHLRNGQTEAKIHLKPEFLGHIRMQVVAENHQVSIKILAEYPFVKEMLENNIQQLKSELQQQGLVVDRLEVSVSRDSAGFDQTRENTPRLKYKHRRSENGTTVTPADEILLETRQTALTPEGSTIVDYFA